MMSEIAEEKPILKREKRPMKTKSFWARVADLVGAVMVIIMGSGCATGKPPVVTLLHDWSQASQVSQAKQ